MMEAAVVFDHEGNPIFWPGYRGATAGSLPDHPVLWERIWEYREKIGGVAHTHPWTGTPSPSTTDLTTFAAIEAGLGVRLTWPIVTMDRVCFFEFDEYGGFYSPINNVDFMYSTPWLRAVLELRRMSQAGG